MIVDLGTVRPGSTIRIPFNSFDKDDGSAITMTNYAAADLLVYKDGNTTERASTAGYTATTDFDGKTGKHLAIIDLADNTTANFWNAGSEYLVAIDAVTVDTVTVGGWIARFRIGHPGAWIDTTIATLSSQTSFTLTTGPAEDDAINGRYVIIHDIASAVQCGQGIVLDYTGSTKTVTLVAGTTFTAAAGDNISIMDLAPLQATVVGRTLDVSATGEAGVDWANVGSPTTSLALTGTTIATTQKVDVETIKTNPVVNGGTITFPTTATLASTTNITAGTVTTATNVTTVNGLAANVVTAAAIADGAIDRATFAADTGLQAVRSNTAQAGSSTTITLDASASATNSLYKHGLVVITGGTGAGQCRAITAYVGATKVATISPSWTTQPDNTSTFAVLALSVPPSATIAFDTLEEAISTHTGTAGSLGAAINLLATDHTDIITLLVSTGVVVTTNNDKTGYALTAAYDAAKTAAQAGDTMKVSSGVGAGQISLTSGKVDVGKINGTTVNGNGSGTPWGP
jgi:hypothetical protein